MKYLITGSAGFIGTNLVNYLKERDEEVIEIDYPIDVTQKIPISNKIDVFVHLAAETDVRTSIFEPGETFLRNCRSTANVLEAARWNKARFVFASSCGASNPANSYAASKLACEALCTAYRKSYGMDISVLRLANVYGPHSLHKSSVIAKFINNILDNKPLQIFGDGHQVRDFIYVEDVCKAIYECFHEYEEIATGRLTSINNLIDLLSYDKVEYSDPVQGEVTKPETSTWSKCEYSLKEGLELTMNWFKENYKPEC